ncbi:MAG: hypothetical protein O3C57_02285 [Verrucomicrobia bacterium]|nr:hypothetical protein [Verrucomicrobiota bacterium]
MESITGIESIILLSVALLSGGGMFFVLSKYIKRLRQIEDELFGRPISPDTVIAFIRELYKAEKNETNLPE